MIKTFRGMIADGGQDTVLLHTNDGSTGYRIVKFDFVPNAPTTSSDNIIQIWKTEQTSVPTSSGTVDFSNNHLLGALFYNTGKIVLVSFFDQEIFNQDIYITHTDNTGSTSANYYIELEQVKLDINSNTVATLKDMRNTAIPRP